jgi:hypothetical protein
VGSVAYGSGVGKDRVIRWDLRSQAFGVHASAASFNDLSMASAEMGHLGLGVGIVQAQLVTPVNALMGHLAENIYNMGVANATQGHTVAAPGQTQLHILPAVGTEQGHTATPIVLVKNLPAANASMGHEATPDTLAKVVLAANATQGHTATPVPIGLTVVNATMGHNGLAVEFPTGGAANLTVVAGTMPHDGQGVEGFSPTQLADLVLWLAPESGYVVSGAVVEQWNDKSGLDNHATNAVSASMPVLVSAASNMNGHNVLRFNPGGSAIKKLFATNVAAVSAINASTRSTTNLAVVVRPSANSTGRILNYGITSAITNNARILGITTGKFLLQETITATTSQSTFASANVDTNYVFRTHWNSVATVWVNGSKVLTSAKVSSGGNNTIGADPMIIIGSNGNDSNAFTGQIAEIIVGSTAWSSAQGRELDKLLGAKYGIAIT